MKTRTCTRSKPSHLLWVATVSFCVVLPSVLAQGTAFNYQGKLTEGGAPANGLYDMMFSLFNAPSNGVQVAGTIFKRAIPVTAGVFTVPLDFGPDVFNGTSYWLRVAVRTNGSGEFIALYPFQPLLPMPYSIYAYNAGQAVQAQVADSVQAANIVGTVSPQQLPGDLVRNYQKDVHLGGVFEGDGSGLTNLNPANLRAGTANIDILGNAATAGVASTVAGSVSDQALSANIPRLNADNTFAGANKLVGMTIATNTGNVFHGTFFGSGAGLTDLNPSLSSVVNANSITIGRTNFIAPLSVAPNMPSSSVGRAGTAANPLSLVVAGGFAYVSGGALQIFDVRDPQSPVLVGLIGSGSESVVVAGGYAYAVGTGGLEILDISDPSAPVLVGTADAGGLSIAVAGRYAYVIGNSGLQVVDVSNSSAPTLCRTLGSGGRRIVVEGRYAYVLGSALNIFDLSNPSAPLLVGSTVAAGASLAVAGGYGYVVGSSLQVYDVSKPSQPTMVGTASASGNSISVLGRFACVAGSSALQVFDVSNPAVPNLIGSASAAGNAVTVAGRYAYVIGQGLQIFDLGGAYIQQLEAGTIETGQLQIHDALAVGNTVDVRGGLTVGATARVSSGLSVDDGTNVISLRAGRLGIGTNAPQQALHVIGDILASGTVIGSSDRNVKENFCAVSTKDILDKVSILPISAWNYQADAKTRHIGPMAQDFYAAFHVGADDKHIAMVDADGIALAAIQGVNQKFEERLQQKEMEIAELKNNIAELRALMSQLAQQLKPGER